MEDEMSFSQMDFYIFYIYIVVNGWDECIVNYKISGVGGIRL